MLKKLRGFTLVELMVVLTIIGLLISIVVPDYVGRTRRAEEAVLKQNLASFRDTIDKYYGDTGRYPDSLEDLVTKKYLRSIPPDPLTESAATWVTVPPENAAKGMVYDVKSGAPGTSSDGRPYAEW